tara:strand:- start:179 stop:358 length:180 start_codon:yes stop_codon:yes gene_type:complete
MNYIISNYQEMLAILFAVIGVASMIAKLTPTQVDNQIIDKILAILNGLALNPKSDKGRK